MRLRLIASALVIVAALLASPARPDPAPIPFLTQAELNCQKTTFTTMVSYLQRVFAARQACFDKVTKEALPQTVDCRAPVDTGTGDDATDDRIGNAEASLAIDIQTTCLNVQLEKLGYPGFCPDPFGPPYDTFDHEQCLIDTANGIIDRLLEIEHPPFPGKLETEDIVCQDEIARKSSSMFVQELDDRTRCEQKRFELRVPEETDCRAEEDPLAPGTGDPTTDTNIVRSHDNVLRGIANACGRADLFRLGFPHLCPNPEGSLFSIAALTECMYTTHHFDLIRLINRISPTTNTCGDGILDFGEQCDDGRQDEGVGDHCGLECRLFGAGCGDADGVAGVTIRDALFVLRRAVALEVCDIEVCDVTGDCQVTSVDALTLLRFVVGLPVTLRCPLSGSCPPEVEP